MMPETVINKPPWDPNHDGTWSQFEQGSTGLLDACTFKNFPSENAAKGENFSSL